MFSKTFSRTIGRLMGLLLLCSSTPAFAGYYSVLHNNTDTNSSTGNAICVAMPSSDNGRIQITRIRLSTTKTSSLDYFFRSERNQESLGNTRSLTGVTCTLPGCLDVFTLDGVKAGELYDMNGLELSLSPGHRLLLHTASAIGGSDYFTVEVWWREL